MLRRTAQIVRSAAQKAAGSDPRDELLLGVSPNSAADPGLVFDSNIFDWLGFLCGTQLDPAYCTSRGIAVVSPSNFNGASIAVAALAGSKTVSRTVTNVGAKGTYNVTAMDCRGLRPRNDEAGMDAGSGPA